MDTFNTDAQPLAQKASKVAIITRTKNRNLLLDRCIRSVLAQTEQDWVHVIVNDGGEAAPLDELISAYQAQYRGRLKVIHNPVSVGMEAASNIGINNSESTYLVILDDDDTWHAKFLEKMTAALATETWAGTRGMFCHTRIVHEKIVGESVVITGSEEFNNWIEHIDFLQLFAWNRFTPVCFVFERAALEEGWPVRRDAAGLRRLGVQSPFSEQVRNRHASGRTGLLAPAPQAHGALRQQRQCGARPASGVPGTNHQSLGASRLCRQDIGLRRHVFDGHLI